MSPGDYGKGNYHCGEQKVLSRNISFQRNCGIFSNLVVYQWKTYFSIFDNPSPRYSE